MANYEICHSEADLSAEESHEGILRSLMLPQDDKVSFNKKDGCSPSQNRAFSTTNIYYNSKLLFVQILFIISMMEIVSTNITPTSEPLTKIDTGPNNKWRIAFFGLIFLMATLIFYFIYISKTAPKQTVNNTIPTSPPTSQIAETPEDNELSSGIYFSQLQRNNSTSYLEIYHIEPQNLKAQMLYTISYPGTKGDFASGSYNSYGANNSVQWSENGKIIVFRVDNQGGMTPQPPLFTAFYLFNPQTQKSELIYKTDKGNLPSWILSPDGKTIYAAEGDVKIGDIANLTGYHLVAIDVASKKSNDYPNIPELTVSHQDAFGWSTDEQKIIWMLEENKQYYLVSYDPAGKTLAKEKLEAADTTYGPNMKSFSDNQQLYASAGFFGTEIFLYDLISKKTSKVSVNQKIGSSRIIFNENNEYLLTTTRKDNPDNTSQPFSELRKIIVENGSNTLLGTTEGKPYGAGYFVYELTKYGFLIELNNGLYLYRDNELKLVSGITLTRGTMGIKDL